MSDRYNFSLTTFSPSGKLVQIEYALNTVNQGSLSIGIKVDSGVVLITEKKTSSALVDSSYSEKIASICDNIGMVYSGLGPDARLIILRARKLAQSYIRTLGENPPVAMLVRDIAHVFQEFTQSGGVRPFGVSLLVCGYDKDHGFSLYQVDPSGTYWAWKAACIGKNFITAKSFLEKRYMNELDIDDAIQCALQALKQNVEGFLLVPDIEIGVCKSNGFSLLTNQEISQYLV